MKTVISYFLFLFAFSFVNPGFSTILNVPDDHEDIRSAIEATEDGDTVLVQPGTYPEFIRFPNRSVTLASLFLTTGDPAYMDSTVLTGNGHNSVVQFIGLEAVSIFTGFSITNGNAADGGGVLVRGSSPILTDLKVFGNTSSGNGGGLYAVQSDSLVVRDCIFSDNTCDENGGGVGIFQGNATLTNVEIFQNESSCGGGGGSPGGGGISILQAEGHVEFVDGKIYENTSLAGGGINMSCGSTASFRNVELSNNTAQRGGGICMTGLSEIDMQYCLVVNNTATDRGSALFFSGEREQNFTNVTITQNISNDIVGIYAGGESTIFFTNCIIYENGEQGLYCLENSTISMAFTDIAGGEDGVMIDGRATISWLDGNIDADPLFAGIECRDYSLLLDSPCLDAGDPDSPKDADSTLSDMGGIPYLRLSSIRGLVRDAANRERLENVNIDISNGFHTISNENGQYDLMALSGIFDVTFSLEGYNDSVFTDVEFNLNDTLELNVGLLHPGLRVSDAELNVSVEHGFVAMEQISISNDANGPLEWSAEFTVEGVEGMAPWEIRSEIPVGSIVDDNQIRGTAYDGENYWFAGRGENAPMIYVLNSELELINQFEQPGNSRRGIRDLAWDGELFWGSGDGEVIGFNSDGEVVSQWEGPFNPNSFIAWDNERDLLWICSTLSNIVACDRNGELQFTINQNSHRIYGLAYRQDDPDDCPLYVLHKKQEMGFSSMSKVNVETGEFIFIRDFTESGGMDLDGAFITQDYDRYGGWVMMTISDFSPNDGNDRLEIFQLESNLFFVDIIPTQGIINAGETCVIDLSFESIDANGVELDFGTYEGNLALTHNAMGGQTFIPIQLNVLDPASAETGATRLPNKFEIASIYPNPFNSFASIDFSLPEASIVNLSLYDLSGRLVKNLARGLYTAGNHDVAFDGSTLVSGLYLVKIQAGNRNSSRKVMLLK